MATIIDRDGGLWRRVGITDTDSPDSDEYELIDTAPQLQYPINIDIRLAITVDGKLYDTYQLSYILDNISNFIQLLPVFSDWDEYYVVLTSDYNCYIIDLNGDRYIHIGSDVTFITCYYDNILMTRGREWFIIENIHSYSIIGRVINEPPNLNEVMYNTNGVLVTYHNIYRPRLYMLANVPILEFDIIPRRSENTIVGMVDNLNYMIIIDPIDNEVPEYRVYNYSHNGEITPVNITNIDILNDYNWIAFIELGIHTVLLTLTGESYYVVIDDNSIQLERTKIPSYILSKVQIRNAMNTVRSE